VTQELNVGRPAAHVATEPMTVESVAYHAARISDAMATVILGKPAVIRLTLVALLTEGHLLIEDVPGTGKTNLAKALARCVDASVSRVQFTPDLMPSDVTGVSVYNRTTTQFTFQPGPVFANILVADEINRASPKTQSALLESMEERQVTVDGTTYPLARPFLVLATQNPVDMEGTYPLPEAQRDRFLARTAIGYPDPASEAALLADREITDPLANVQPVVDTATVMGLIQAVNRVHLAPVLRQYIVAIVGATRIKAQVRLGASPRALLHLGRAAKAAAALAGRDYVIPDDIAHLAAPVLAHRLLLTVEAHAAQLSAERIIADILSSVPVPTGHRG
jgi:MoxR-like ATPase